MYNNGYYFYSFRTKVGRLIHECGPYFHTEKYIPFFGSTCWFFRHILTNSMKKIICNLTFLLSNHSFLWFHHWYNYKNKQDYLNLYSKGSYYQHFWLRVVVRYTWKWVYSQTLATLVRGWHYTRYFTVCGTTWVDKNRPSYLIEMTYWSLILIIFHKF